MVARVCLLRNGEIDLIPKSSKGKQRKRKLQPKWGGIHRKLQREY